MNSVAACLRADVNHGIADAGGFAVEDFVVLKDAQCEYVHQRIPVVALFEHALPTHRRYTEAVPVVRYARDYALEDALIARAGLWIVQPSESNRVHHRNGPRAH